MVDRVLVGDLFQSKAQTLVNTVNCVGVMGKGLALAFKKRFPDMFKDYAVKCKRGEVKLGRPYLYKHSMFQWILLFPTKNDWRSVSKLSDLEEGLRWLKKHYKEWEIQSIAVPPLGCGLGALDWRIVGPTLYRHLNDLDIPVELYAPQGTPAHELQPEFLANPSSAQSVEESAATKSKIESGFIVVLEALRRLEELPYHWPVGRTAFQKICYFGTLLGLGTGLEFRRSSYGPFSDELKSKMTQLSNNGLVREEKNGKMFKVLVGHTFDDAQKLFTDEIQAKEDIINRLVDLFCRLNTHKAEIAATVHFASKTMKVKHPGKPTEEDVLNEVMEWKKRRKPEYNRQEVAQTIRNLAIHRWIDIAPSQCLDDELVEA